MLLNQQIHFHLHGNGLVPIFVYVAYKHDVVVVIKMGAYIHGVLIFYGCLLSGFLRYVYIFMWPVWML